MLTLKDIKELDLNNIDFAKLAKGFIQRKDFLLNFTLIIVTLFLLVKIYDSRKNTIQNTKTKIKALEEKINVISDYQNAQTELEKTISTLPKGLIEMDSIIEKINDFAIKYNIQISSFNPLGTENIVYYTKTGLRLAITSPSYENLGFFIHDIESSDYNFRVERWSATPAPNDPSAKQISSTIEITSIDFVK